jgi:ectoine hydroxylase-related dioxygenase (phytanoyl-CoA dioxygenase family)|tara:strand:+ start:32508 stop:33395 length:888 start_codon:yes stop_codon:yes gene_type:complete
MAPKLDKAFLTDGATVVRGLFDENVMAKLQAIYDYCFEHPTPIALSSERGEDRSYTDMLNSDPKVRELTEKALDGLPIGEMLAEVWGSEHIWYLTEEIFLRESKSNKNRGVFHQDSSLAPWQGEHWANFWISFDPVPEENGLEILKGTHLGPQYDYVPYDSQNPSDLSQRGEPFWGDRNDPPWPAQPDIEGALAKDPSAYEVLKWGVEPGDVVLFHPHTIHGGAPTGPQYPRRRTLSLRFFGDKSYYKPIPPGGVGQTEEMHAERIRLEEERGVERTQALKVGDLWRGPHYLQLR